MNDQNLHIGTGRHYQRFHDSLVEPNGRRLPLKRHGHGLKHDRNEAIYNDVLEGMTQNEVAKKYGISRPRVAQICWKYRDFYASNET